MKTLNMFGIHLEVPSESCDMPCHKCISDYGIRHPHLDFLPLSSAIMIVCEICGNKRCPHASDHRRECSGSNEPGQKGSLYE